MWRPSITSNEVLIHHGIKDQQWGRRRWQNPDGSLTPAGKIRYGKGESGRTFSGNDAKEILKASSNISNESSKIARKASEKGRRKTREEIDLSDMSNKDLHIAINRMSLEKQYKDLATADVRTGWDVASDILDVAGSVMAIGASAATIYALTRKR